MSMEFVMTTDLATAIPQDLAWNYEELEKELTERLQHYKSLVITEDTIKEGKEDRAKLNKLREALETRRKEIKKLCLVPYDSFESREKKLIALIDEPIAAIDSQLKAFDEQRKAEKRQQIEAAYDKLVTDTIKDIIPLGRIFDNRWLNATMSMAKVEEDIITKSKRVFADLLALDSVPQEYAAAVRAKYIETLDIAEAIRHQQTLQQAAEAFKAREEARAAQQAEKAAEPKIQPQESPVQQPAPQEESENVYLLRLEFQLTRSEADALKKFLTNNNIHYRKI